ADAGELVHDGNPVLLQERTGADAGKLEELGGADRPGGEDHLAPRRDRGGLAFMRELDPGRAPSVELQAARLRVREDPEVGAAHHRAQERLRRVPPYPAPLVHLEVADALVVAAIEVGRLRDAALDRRFEKGVEDLPREALLLH